MEEQREGAGGEQGKNGGTMKVKEEQTEGEEQTEEAGTRLVKEEQREERITRKKWWEDSSEGEGRCRRGTRKTNDLWFFFKQKDIIIIIRIF